MSFDITDAILSLFSAIAGLGVAKLALMGKREEVAGEQLRTLISGQADNIARLEARIEKIEQALDEEREARRAADDRVAELRSGLKQSIDYQYAIARWMREDMTVPPPAPPSLKWLESLVEV